MMWTYVPKSNWKIYNLPFDYSQSLTTVVKMVSKSAAKKEEVRANIKTRSKIVVLWNKYLLTFLLFTDLLMWLMTQSVDITWSVDGKKEQTLKKKKKKQKNKKKQKKTKFDSGWESIENAQKSRRPKSASCDEIVSKVKETVRDVRYTKYNTWYSTNCWHLTIKSFLHLKNILMWDRFEPGGCLICWLMIKRSR